MMCLFHNFPETLTTWQPYIFCLKSCCSACPKSCCSACPIGHGERQQGESWLQHQCGNAAEGVAWLARWAEDERSGTSSQRTGQGCIVNNRMGFLIKVHIIKVHKILTWPKLVCQDADASYFLMFVYRFWCVYITYIYYIILYYIILYICISPRHPMGWGCFLAGRGAYSSEPQGGGGPRGGGGFAPLHRRQPNM